jgi:hypothetical protein
MIESNHYAFAEPLTANFDINHSTHTVASAYRVPTELAVESRTMQSDMHRARRRAGGRRRPRTKPGLLSVLSMVSTAMADCIALSGSTTCPAFETASVATSDYLEGL